jgi:hypothetical protein
MGTVIMETAHTGTHGQMCKHGVGEIRICV